MRLCFLTVRRVPDVPSPLLAEVSERLAARGHVVDHRITEELLVDANGLSPAHDLYLLKSHTELSLSVAAGLSAQGARLLNPYDACAAAQDKLLANRRLHAAGVPVPRTVVTGSWDRVAGVLDGTPRIVKPVRGHRGQGVEVVRTPLDVAGRPEPTTALVVQDLVDGPVEDLKVYVVGDRVWAVRKPFSADSFTRPGRPVPVTPAVRRIARRTAAVTGLGLFGLDVIEGPDGPVVVDLNYFPGYKGCEGVAEPMTSYIDRYARGGHDLALPPLLPASRPVPVAVPAAALAGT
ncbi:MAG: ATP-grasp domain-containing protein [Nocardioidaceae bacterium]